MFKQILYKVVFKRGNDIEIHLVTRMDFNHMGVTKAYFEVEVDGEDGQKVMKEVSVPVDHVNVCLQEFTSKFSKSGVAIMSGDIIKGTFKVNAEAEEKDICYSITFFEGGFYAINELYEKCIALSEEFVRSVEVVGTIYTAPELIEKPIDESVFTPKEETENNGQENQQ